MIAMTQAQPYLIAVAGASCSGKTSLARFLAAELNASILPVDAYYRDLSHLDADARSRVNFDAPEAIDVALLAGDLRSLLNGRTIERPVYDFTTHTRSSRREQVSPGTFLILEGLFALYWEQIRELCRTKVFVELDDRICFERRMARDIRERGRTAASIRKQYEETVRPMAERYILPSRRFADVVVSGTDPPEVSARKVKLHIETGLS